mmetsp:Transcript_22972/g.49707  ORF Transcript_22972/g.49707 Transcript_22972/m.49707 type:complete len:224 (+) Transcript_22972:1078-1749(+)
MQTRLGTTLEHPQHTRLGSDGKEHKDGKHASCRDVITIDKPKSIGDGIPHSIQRSTLPTQLGEPFRERNIIKITDHIHTTVKINQGPYNRRGTQPQSIMEFILKTQLFRPSKSLQPTHGSANGKTKVQRAQLPTLVDKRVNMLLDTKLGIKATGAFHNTEQIVITSEEDMQSHLDVIAFLIQPGTNLPADEGTELEHFNVVSRIGQVHGGDHAGESGSDNSDF